MVRAEYFEINERIVQIELCRRTADLEQYQIIYPRMIVPDTEPDLFALNFRYCPTVLGGETLEKQYKTGSGQYDEHYDRYYARSSVYLGLHVGRRGRQIIVCICYWI